MARRFPGTTTGFAGVAHRVDRRPPHGPMVGVIERRPGPPRQVEVDRDHDVGAEPANRARDGPPELDTLHHEPIGQSEELDAGHAHGRRAAPLLFLASGPHSAGPSESMPASPLVASTYVTSLPWPVQRAIAPATPYSRSSGWAAIATARSQSSGIGSIARTVPARCESCPDAEPRPRGLVADCRMDAYRFVFARGSLAGPARGGE